MLTSLSLKNFKSWKSIDDMRLAPITGLFGANSSGKTSIIQLLLLLKQTVESSDRAQPLDFGGDQSLVALESFRDIVHGHDPTGRLWWSLAWRGEMKIPDPEDEKVTLFASDQHGFEATVTATDDRPVVNELRHVLGDNAFAMQRTADSRYKLSVQATGFAPKRTVGRPWNLPAPVKCYGFPDQARTYFQNTSFLSDLELAFEGLFSRVYYLGPLREYPKRHYSWAGRQPKDVGRAGEDVVEALLASRSQGLKISRGKGHKRRFLEEEVAEWLQRLGLIESFSVKRVAAGSSLYQVHVRKDPAAAQVLLTDVGFGVSQILPVIALCYYVPPGSVVILEQPEIHLHPSVQAGLADVIIDAVRVRGIQVIVESHSEHFLLRLQRRIAEQQLDPDEVALYFCEIRDGSSSLTPLEVDLFGNIANWPRDFFGDPFTETAEMTKAALERQMASSA